MVEAAAQMATSICASAGADDKHATAMSTARMGHSNRGLRTDASDEYTALAAGRGAAAQSTNAPHDGGVLTFACASPSSPRMPSTSSSTHSQATPNNCATEGRVLPPSPLIASLT